MTVCVKRLFDACVSKMTTYGDDGYSFVNKQGCAGMANIVHSDRFNACSGRSIAECAANGGWRERVNATENEGTKLVKGVAVFDELGAEEMGKRNDAVAAFIFGCCNLITFSVLACLV